MIARYIKITFEYLICLVSFAYIIGTIEKPWTSWVESILCFYLPFGIINIGIKMGKNLGKQYFWWCLMLSIGIFFVFLKGPIEIIESWYGKDIILLKTIGTYGIPFVLVSLLVFIILLLIRRLIKKI